MTKRHTKQDKKQMLGQYFTTNVDEILEGFEYLIPNKAVVDPFAGGWDLLKWAEKLGAERVIGYDIEPRSSDTEYRNSLLDPADYSDTLVLTNPPYLSSNKSKGKYKDIYNKWQQNDLYKCFLATLDKMNASESIIIIPSNFLCESSPKARKMLFANYDVIKVKYWKTSVFDDATTGVTALAIRKKEKPSTIQTFQCQILPENKFITMVLDEQYGYIHGGKEIYELEKSYIFDKITTETDEVNTNIVVGCLDNGKYKLGFHYNDGKPIKAPTTVITTFQVNTNGFTLTEDQQRIVVDMANRRLQELREKYDSMFLSNYMGATQKIMSVNIAKSLLSDSVYKLFGKKHYKDEFSELFVVLD